MSSVAPRHRSSRAWSAASAGPVQDATGSGSGGSMSSASWTTWVGTPRRAEVKTSVKERSAVTVPPPCCRPTPAACARSGCRARGGRPRARRRSCRRRGAGGRPDGVAGRERGRPGCRRGWSAVDITTVASGTATLRVAAGEHPPAAVGRRPQAGVVRPEVARGAGEEVGRQVRGVHADLDDGATAGVLVRGDEPLGEGAATLGGDRPAADGVGQLRPACCVGEVAGQRQVSPRAGRRLHGGDRVEQRRGGEVRGDVVAGVHGEPGLGPAGDGRLGHHQDGEAAHDSTRQKSRAVRTVPVTEPETLERVPSARGW